MEAASSIRVSMVMIAAWACVLLLSTGLAASQSFESVDPGLDAPYASDYTLSAPSYTRLAGGTPPLLAMSLCRLSLSPAAQSPSRKRLAQQPRQHSVERRIDRLHFKYVAINPFNQPPSINPENRPHIIQ
jgi:hypothetical protein